MLGDKIHRCTPPTEQVSGQLDSLKYSHTQKDAIVHRRSVPVLEKRVKHPFLGAVGSQLQHKGYWIIEWVEFKMRLQRQTLSDAHMSLCWQRLLKPHEDHFQSRLWLHMCVCVCVCECVLPRKLQYLSRGVCISSF